MENVQIRFKEMRLQLGLTQPQIAEILGIKTAMWQKLESGRTPDPRTSTIANICNTLGISSDWLLGIDRGEGTEVANLSAQMRNEVYRASKAIQKGGLSNKEKQAIIEQLQALIDQLNK